jgi:hypothetical protein
MVIELADAFEWAPARGHGSRAAVPPASSARRWNLACAPIVASLFFR